MPDNTPLLDRMELERSINYEPSALPPSLPNIPYKSLETPYSPQGGDGEKYVSPLNALENAVLSIKGGGKLTGGSIPRSIAESVSPRYNMFVPGDYDNEDAYAQGQGWTSKMVNGVGKGLVLTGTTLLQSTAGLLHGLVRAASDGRAASFYDNEFNRNLDELNKKMEDLLPNYYTNVERNAAWYSRNKLFTANFFWDGIIKNMGFAAGAALSGGIYTAGLKALPLTSRLFSIGKAAETLAATEEGLLAADKVAETYGKVKNLSDKFLSSYKTLNKGGRAVVAGLSTTGEAGFEAYHNMQQFREDRIKEWKDTHGGEEPRGADLQAINAEAENVGNSSFLLNTALLSVTNYIQFPKLLGSSYKAEKGIINGLTKEIGEITTDATGKYIAKTPTTGFGKILSTLNKVRPYTFSTSEAFEEGAQYSIQVGTQDYYDKKYKGDTTADFLTSAVEGVKKTIGTDEGMENVLIGGLSGSLMMARGTFREQREQTKNTAEAIAAFNKFKLSDFTKETVDSVNRGTVLQQEREQTLKQGDVLESKDKETDYIINYLTPRIKYGRMDLVKSDIADLKQLASSDDGFAQLIGEGKALEGDTKEAYTQRLVNLENTAENMKSLYQSLNLRYGNLIDKDGKPLYSSDVMDKMVYAATKIADYDQRIPKLSSSLISSGVDTVSVIDDIVNNNFDSYNKAVEAIDAMKDKMTDDQLFDMKQSLQDIAELTLRRQKFLKEYNDIKKSPEKYKEVKVEPIATTEDKKGPTVTVKTKSGKETTLEVGEEYVAGSKEIKTEQGVTLDKFLKFKVVGKAENGDIIIQTEDGKQHGLKPSAFEEYNLGKFKDLNLTARFYLDNFDKVFNYRFKGGKEVQGKLVFDKATKSLYFESIETKKNGKPLHRIPVTRDQFSPKEGYTRAQIWSNSKFSPESERILSEPETQEEASAKTNLEAKLAERRRIITEVANQTKERLEEVDSKIVSKREELSKINEELNELREVKAPEARTKREKAIEEKYPELSRQKAKFSKVLSTTTRAVTKLSRLKADLEREIEELQSQKDELEFNISYLEDFTQNLQELPEDFREMVADLKDQIGNLENLSISTGAQINQFSKLIDSLNDTIKDLVSLLKSSFQKFDSDYPDYIKNNFNEMMDNPLYEKVKELKEYIADYTLLQDTQKEISVSEEQVKDLTEKIEDLYKQLDEIGKEQRAKEIILKRFEDALKKFEAQKAEEQKIARSTELFKQFIGTMSNEVQNPVGEDDRKYQPESKKSDLDVVGSTLPTDDGKAHQARANRFGNRFQTLSNRDDIRGIIVTQNTEDQVIPGLVDHLTGGNAEMGKTVIALVMVNESGELVDEFGNPIPQGANLIDSAIYQVFPTEKLEQVYNQETRQKETMFRDSTPEEVRESLRQQYTAWREARLAETQPPVPQGIDASFGFPEYVKTLNSVGKEVINYDARNSVESTGMATAASLKEDPLVMVNTTNEEVSNGSVTFKAPKGRVFLRVPGGLIKLFNNRFNEVKAKTLYDVILQVSKNSYGQLDEKASNEEKAKLKDKNNILFNWLRSVVYWGIAKDMQTGQRKPAGYNNVWFEEITDEEGNPVTKLFISGRGEGFIFSPTNVEQNKEEIISLLQNLYHNVSASMVSDEKSEWSKPYYEITGIDKNGDPVTRKWDNYQSYLLSSKGRTEEEIPLTTPIQKLSDAKEVNRKGVYFTLTSTPDDYVIPTVSPKAPTATKAAPATPAKAIVDDGKTVNTIVNRVLGELKFTIDKDRNIVLAADENGDFDASIKKAAQIAADTKGWPALPTEETQKAGQQTGVDLVFSVITRDANALLDQQAQPVAQPQAQQPTPASTAPASDLGFQNLGNIGNQGLAIMEADLLKQGRYILTNIASATPEQLEKIENDIKTLQGKYDIKVDRTARTGKGPAIVITLNKKTAPAASQNTAFVLDGKTVNTVVSTSVGNIRFLADENGKVSVLEDFETDTPIAELMKVKNYSRDEAISFLTAFVTSKVNPQVVAKTIPVAPPTTNFTQADDDEWNNRPRDTGRDDAAYRMQIVEKINRFEKENWKKLEEFLKKAFPNVPVYRVKNVIKATNGRQAWGMFKNGALYIYQNAEVGTGYHEVFEAVWKMFTDSNERNSVLNEFRGRKGTFIDRETGRELAYKDATDSEIKEQLAEEFRDYVLTGKIPAKPTEGKPFIIKLFMDLVNFIKEFFTGPKAQTNTANLFSKIGNGYYRSYIPYETNLSYAKSGIIDIDDAVGTSQDDFRIATIPSTQVHEIIQQMTYSTLTDLTQNNKSLFEIGRVNKVGKAQLYDRLYNEIRSLIGYEGTLIEQAIEKGEITAQDAAMDYNNLKDLYRNIKNEWPDIMQKHEEYLKTYNIEFDDNDNIAYHEESGKSDYQDARKIDAFRKANAAIKILFATVPITRNTNEGPKVKRSSVGGVITLPMDKVYITLKNRLHNATTLDEMLERLRKFSIENPDYQALYKRLTKSTPLTKTIDWKKLENTYDMHLLGAFWKSMRSQDADKKIVFILPGEEVVIGDSSLASAAGSHKFQMFNSFVSTIRNGMSKYVKYDSKEKKYNATTEINNVTLTAKDLSSYTTFLNSFGISFTPAELRKKLNDKQLQQFRKATEGIRDSVAKFKDIATLNRQSLNIDGRLMQLGVIRAIIETPEFESTYFNMNGERVQTYIGTNAGSDLYDTIAKAKNINELANGQYSYLIPGNDVNSEGSVVLNAMFNITGDNVTGNRNVGTEELMKVGYVDGINDETTGKKKEASSVTIRERFIQEMNLNLEGYYMNLVPGDAAIEWMTKLGNHVTKEMLDLGYDDILNIFKNYFVSEVKLSRDTTRKIEKVGDREATDLRFFKAILGKTQHDQIVNYIKANKNKSAEEIYNDNKKMIDNAVKDFLKEEAEDTQNLLEQFDILKYEEGELILDKIAIPKEDMNEIGISKNIELIAINYVIANIEFHKLLYSDPYQYKDELKRVKNFNSPRQPLMNASAEVRTAMNRVYNKGYKTDDKIGYTDMLRNFFRSTTIADVISKNDLKGYTDFEETDGGGYISMKANRLYRIASGEWNDNEEMQYRYDVAYEKTIKGVKLSPEEAALYKKGNPNVRSAYTPIKPIVSGNKADGKGYNDVVLDKFALVPLSFRALHEINPESNAIKFYNKMQDEDIDYAVYGTGRKVGAGVKTPIYNIDGSFNTNSFAEINNIPFAIMGTQAEVPSKDTPKVRQGTQITKLVTMDFMEAGVPIDFEPGGDINNRFIKWMGLSENEKMKSPIYKEIKNNQKLLEERLEEGFKVLLKKLGISQTKEGFEITDRAKLIDTLKNEILKREVNENITDAFEGFKSGDVVIEATPAYQQIRNILYSIADSNVISPRVTGGMKVQIPSTMLESVRKTSKEGVFESDVLNFYSKTEDGKKVNVCEIMVARWFQSDKTDEELIKYFNEDPEGQKQIAAIFGVGFRIPTQKQNSIDAFKIKKFLPNSMGDSVVIPSALVKKAGSDFDIDKLSIYLKNVYEDGRGNIKIIPFVGYGEEAKKELEKMYDNGEFLTKEQMQELDRIIVEEKDPLFAKVYDEEGNVIDSPENKMFRAIFNVAFTDQEITKDFVKSLKKDNVKQEFIDGLYRKSLENAYIQSLENLITHPDNFERLTVPNSADDLKALSKEIVEKTGGKQFDYSSVGSMINRRFMTSLRQAFVSGKYAIGIAAVAQTNHSQNQRTNMFVDPSRITSKSSPISEADRKFLNDGSIKFEQYNKINIPGKGVVASLSMAKDKAGKYISDVVSQFIDGYVDISKGPWVMELGAKQNVAGTWLFLSKIGVPVKTIGFFMNQPIIRQYLQNLENAGYSWLFNDTMVGVMDRVYEDTPIQSEDFDRMLSEFKIPNDTELENTLGKNIRDLDPQQKLNQRFILREFLKYAKMAEHVFVVTQGANFDTANINDPFLLFKKQMQLKKAQTKTIISAFDENKVISGVDAILKNSFIGKLSGVMGNIRDAYAQILISDRIAKDPTEISTRDVLEAILTPYVDLNDRDFVKLAQKATADIFDWAVQTNTQINKEIGDILLGKGAKMSAAQEVMNFVNEVKKDPQHPLINNVIVNSITKMSSDKENTPDNLQILGMGNKVYDQNQIIYGFNEMKKHLMNVGNSQLYDKLIKLAVLQSGLPNSPISFTSMIPYADFKEMYNETLSVLDKMPNLADFYRMNVFERNNWNDRNVVEFKKASYLKLKEPFFDYATGFERNYIYAREREFVPKALKIAMNKKQIPEVIMISPYTQEGRSEFIVYSWEDRISREKKAEMRRKADYSFIHKGLFKRVYDSSGNPLISMSTSKKGKTYENYVYKMVNAWGASFRANEYYEKENISDRSSTIAQPSIIDNGFIKVEAPAQKTLPGTVTTIPKTTGEVEDGVIEKIVLGDVSLKPTAATETPVTADEASIKSQIAELEQKKKTTGITGTEAAKLAKLKSQIVEKPSSNDVVNALKQNNIIDKNCKG